MPMVAQFPSWMMFVLFAMFIAGIDDAAMFGAKRGRWGRFEGLGAREPRGNPSPGRESSPTMRSSRTCNSECPSWSHGWTFRRGSSRNDEHRWSCLWIE